MKVAAITDIGLVRKTNEDTYVTKIIDDENYLAFVCDGMGGHLGGDYASSNTASSLENAFVKIKNYKKIKNVGLWIYDTFQEINDEIYDKSQSDSSLAGMGTTISGVVCINNTLLYGHMGDSRIYLYNKDSIQQITTDHTYVNTLLLNGLITYKQAQNHPKKHIITNALGIRREVNVDIGKIDLGKDDGLFICSDGVHNLLDDKRLLKLLNMPVSINEKAKLIKDKVLELGGIDNLTLIILNND